jgi:hypothetical protein
MGTIVATGSVPCGAGISTSCHEPFRKRNSTMTVFLFIGGAEATL